MLETQPNPDISCKIHTGTSQRQHRPLIEPAHLGRQPYPCSSLRKDWYGLIQHETNLHHFFDFLERLTNFMAVLKNDMWCRMTILTTESSLSNPIVDTWTPSSRDVAQILFRNLGVRLDLQWCAKEHGSSRQWNLKNCNDMISLMLCNSFFDFMW